MTLDQVLVGKSSSNNSGESITFVICNLTARAGEMMQLVAQGLSVAQGLATSHTTVNTHLTSIYSKLSIDFRTTVMHFFVEHQFL